MPRKRLISPEFFVHEALYEHEASTMLPLRVAFAGLWTQADRRGVFEWRPNRLKLAVLPYDTIDFSKVLDALASGGFIERYEANGQAYGYIPSFTRWQTFHKAENPSDAPAPPNYRPSTVLAPGEHGAKLPVAVAVTGTDTIAVAGAVRRSAGPGGPPPPAAPTRGGEPTPMSAVDWRATLKAAGAKP